MNKVWNNVIMFLGLTLLTGIIYPLIVTGIAQLTMHQKANGDFISLEGKIVGASLIAQKFENEKYFWGRPSSIDYNPLPSGGSNLGPTSASLKKAVVDRIEKILKYHHVDKEKIPSELLFASGSGLDPHITLQTAYFQIERIAKARGVPEKEVRMLVDSNVIGPTIGFMGEPYINVLMLNNVLDTHFQSSGKS